MRIGNSFFSPLRQSLIVQLSLTWNLLLSRMDSGSRPPALPPRFQDYRHALPHQLENSFEKKFGCRRDGSVLASFAVAPDNLSSILRIPHG